MVEYFIAQYHKTLHLGHLRNNFLGWSVAEIYKAQGYIVHKVQIINDRGIHICKRCCLEALRRGRDAGKQRS